MYYTESMVSKVWMLVIFLTKASCEFRVGAFESMKCTYGERGSLTATCVNATPSYFKSTLYKFDHLDETLRCLNCTLTTIDSNTFDLSGNQIKILELRDSKIENLKPKAFMGLIFLTYLDLSHNKIRSIFPGTFSGTKKISTLDLSNNEISILSESGFAELIELTSLILQRNEIKVIDLKAFNGIKKLQKLDLSFNRISAMNNTLENNTYLEELYLQHNMITQLSGEEFYRLNKLCELNLADNLLGDRINISMTPGNNLRKLHLARNSIKFLWFKMSHLDQLEELDLQDNNITEIKEMPSESMYNLEILQLANNRLDVIKTSQFSWLPQLRELNCSNNTIKEVTITGVFSLQNLHSLDLSSNVISDLDYTALISRVPSLTYLKLDGNKLPCELEDEMETTFADDNFKYVLYDIIQGKRQCEQRPLMHSSYKHLQDVYVETESSPVSGGDIVIFILISFIITAIGILFYLQYLVYKSVQVTSPVRVASTVQLISSESDQREDDFESVRT